MGRAWKALNYIGIFAIYTVVYYSLRYTPFYLNLAAGVRLAALVLLPYRLWPAILLGDVLANTVFTAPRFGVAPYTDLSAVVTIFGYPASTLPAAWFAKRHGIALSTGKSAEVINLFKATAIQMLAGTAAGLAYVLSCAISIEAQKSTFWNVIELYSIGHALGVLTVVPAACWLWRQFADDPSVPKRWPEADYGRLLGWLLTLACFCTIAVLTAQAVGPGKLLFPIRLALFMTIMIMTVREGWRGAALSVLLVNIALEFTQKEFGREPDLATLHEVSTFICGLALWLGALVGKQRATTRRMEADNVRLQQLYKRHAEAPMRMRRLHAEWLDGLTEKLKNAEVELRDSTTDREQTLQLWWRVISGYRKEIRAQREALRPALLDTHGLRVALACGPIANTLRDAGVCFHVHAVDTLEGVDGEMQSTIYQLVHDSIVRRLQRHAVGMVSIKLRCGRLGDRRYVGARVNFAMRPDFETPALDSRGESSDLADLAEIFGGRLTEHGDDRRQYVSAVIFEDSIEAILAPEVLRA